MAYLKSHVIMSNYPHIKKLQERYDNAVNSHSKDIRISTSEIGLLISDINNLLMEIPKQTTAIKELNKTIEDFRKELNEALNDSGYDGGSF